MPIRHRDPTVVNYNRSSKSWRCVWTHLRDVDQQAGVGDVGDADQPLLDDALALDLHAGHGGARRQQQRRRPRARVLPDGVDLLGRHKRVMRRGRERVRIAGKRWESNGIERRVGMRWGMQRINSSGNLGCFLSVKMNHHVAAKQLCQ